MIKVAAWRLPLTYGCKLDQKFKDEESNSVKLVLLILIGLGIAVAIFFLDELFSFSRHSKFPWTNFSYSNLLVILVAILLSEFLFFVSFKSRAAEIPRKMERVLLAILISIILSISHYKIRKSIIGMQEYRGNNPGILLADPK